MTKIIENYSSLLTNHNQLRSIDYLKIKTPIKINGTCLKDFCDKIFHNRSLLEINFFNFNYLPLFNDDHLGDYFVPKLLYRGFEVLCLDLSEVCVGA